MTAPETPKKTVIQRDKYSLHVGRFFEPAPDGEIAFSWVAYDISKYFFEFARNFLVVGALRYAADKTDSWFLQGLFLVSLGAFVMFVYSFLCGWNFKIFAHLHPVAGGLVDGLLNLLVAVLLTLPLYFVIISVTGQMK
jgi:hypothetical protein